MLSSLIDFIKADSFSLQVEIYRKLTGACSGGTAEFIQEQGWENRTQPVTIGELEGFDVPSLNWFLQRYYEWRNYLCKDYLSYLPSEEAWAEYAKELVERREAQIEGKRRAYLHRQAKKCCYEEAAYYHMLKLDWSLDQFIKYMEGVKSTLNKFINSSTVEELMATYHELYSGRDRKKEELNAIGITIYGDANYNDIYHIVGVIINKEIKNRLKTFNFNNMPFDELQKVLRYSDVSLIKILFHVNIVDWNDAYQWASMLRPQIQSYIDNKLSVKISTFTLADVWK